MMLHQHSFQGNLNKIQALITGLNEVGLLLSMTTTCRELSYLRVLISHASPRLEWSHLPQCHSVACYGPECWLTTKSNKLRLPVMDKKMLGPIIVTHSVSSPKWEYPWLIWISIVGKLGDKHLPCHRHLIGSDEISYYLRLAWTPRLMGNDSKTNLNSDDLIHYMVIWVLSTPPKPSSDLD